MKFISSIVALALLSSWLAGPAQARPFHGALRAKVAGLHPRQRVAKARHRVAPKAAKSPCKSCGCK